MVVLVVLKRYSQGHGDPQPSLLKISRPGVVLVVASMLFSTHNSSVTCNDWIVDMTE